MHLNAGPAGKPDNKQICVLVVEDEEAHADLIKHAFSESGPQFRLVIADSISKARNLLAKFSPQLLITDLVLPDGRGVDLIPEKDQACFPIIVMSAHGDEKIAVEAIKGGAIDYVVKSEASFSFMPRLSELALREWECLVERKRAEKEREELLIREQTARLEAERACRVTDEFLAMLSHELRTPLNAVLGWAELLRIKERSTEYLHHALDIIERNARTQASLIDDLLDMSRIIAGRMQINIQEVDLATLVKSSLESIRPLANTREVNLEHDINPERVIFHGDPFRLQQVMCNLLSNAVKFTPCGGRVTISLHFFGAQAEILVKDTGLGITPEFLPHLFERFRQADISATRKYGGLGLGLTIVRQLVELHGGEISATSPGINKGAVFRIVLPLEANPESRSSVSKKTTNCKTLRLKELGRQRALLTQTRKVELCNLQYIDLREEPETNLAGVKILIVDDEQDARDLIRNALEEYNAEIDDASSVTEALKLFEQYQPDILVSDIAIPEEDGYELIRKVRSLPSEHGGNVPAVALTALVGEKERVRALEEGFQVFATKPVEPARLAKQLGDIVRPKH